MFFNMHTLIPAALGQALLGYLCSFVLVAHKTPLQLPDHHKIKGWTAISFMVGIYFPVSPILFHIYIQSSNDLVKTSFQRQLQFLLECTVRKNLFILYVYFLKFNLLSQLLFFQTTLSNPSSSFKYSRDIFMSSSKVTTQPNWTDFTTMISPYKSVPPTFSFVKQYFFCQWEELLPQILPAFLSLLFLSEMN